MLNAPSAFDLETPVNSWWFRGLLVLERSSRVSGPNISSPPTHRPGIKQFCKWTTAQLIFINPHPLGPLWVPLLDLHYSGGAAP